MSFEITSVVHGYYVYKDIWEVEISLKLPCLPETDNHEDGHAVAMFRLYQSSWHSFFSSLSSS